MSESEEMSDEFYVAGKHGSQLGSETGDLADDELREQTPETQDPGSTDTYVYADLSGQGCQKPPIFRIRSPNYSPDPQTENLGSWTTLHQENG